MHHPLQLQRKVEYHHVNMKKHFACSRFFSLINLLFFTVEFFYVDLRPVSCRIDGMSS